MISTRRYWPQYLGALLVVVLLTGVATASAALLTVKSDVDIIANNPITAISKEGQEALADVEPGRPQTVLLIGSDKRSKASVDGKYRDGALSDTLMLARLDPDAGATAVMSIPRDTRAEIPLPGGGVRVAKINEAFADGGEALTIQTVRRLLDLPVHHVVIINFSAFQRAVNYFGGFYQDIDHRYFNDNSMGENYATIDVHPGYQLLKGGDSLDWVRYRHRDNDLIRAARQQEFLRSAKSQISNSQIIDDRKRLLTIFSRYTQTDIRKVENVLSLLKLALNSADQPVRSVRFRVEEQAGSTMLLPVSIDKMREEFTELKASSSATSTKGTPKPKSKKKKSSGSSTSLAPGLIRTPGDGDRADLRQAAFDLSGRLPVYYPSVRLATGSWANAEPTRVYDMNTKVRGKTYKAFRLTYATGDDGQYWGVQGLEWRDPPILDGQHTTVRRKGRTLMAYRTGSRYRMVAWKTPNGVYWVSNTLSNSLTNRQMLDIAANLTRRPG